MKRSLKKRIAFAVGTALAVGGATAEASAPSAGDSHSNSSQREVLIAKAVEDAVFREALLRDPIAAATQLQVLFSDAEAADIRQRAKALRKETEVAIFPLPRIAGAPAGKAKPKVEKKQRDKAVK